METFSVVCVLSPFLVSLYFDYMRFTKTGKWSPGPSPRVNKPKYSANLFKYILPLFRPFSFLIVLLSRSIRHLGNNQSHPKTTGNPRSMLITRYVYIVKLPCFMVVKFRCKIFRKKLMAKVNETKLCSNLLLSLMFTWSFVIYFQILHSCNKILKRRVF